MKRFAILAAVVWASVWVSVAHAQMMNGGDIKEVEATAVKGAVSTTITHTVDYDIGHPYGDGFERAELWVRIYDDSSQPPVFIKAFKLHSTTETNKTFNVVKDTTVQNVQLFYKCDYYLFVVHDGGQDDTLDTDTTLAFP